MLRISTIGVRPNSPPQITSVASSNPRCFRSFNQRGRRLIGDVAILLQIAFEIGVMVPTGVHQHHETNAAFDHAAGQQAVGGEGTSRLLDSTPYISSVAGGFLREIQQLRRGHLHAERQFIRIDARGDLHVAGLVEMRLVQVAQGI